MLNQNRLHTVKWITDVSFNRQEWLKGYKIFVKNLSEIGSVTCYIFIFEKYPVPSPVLGFLDSCSSSSWAAGRFPVIVFNKSSALIQKIKHKHYQCKKKNKNCQIFHLPYFCIQYVMLFRQSLNVNVWTF